MDIVDQNVSTLPAKKPVLYVPAFVLMMILPIIGAFSIAHSGLNISISFSNVLPGCMFIICLSLNGLCEWTGESIFLSLKPMFRTGINVSIIGSGLVLHNGGVDAQIPFNIQSYFGILSVLMLLIGIRRLSGLLTDRILLYQNPSREQIQDVFATSAMEFSAFFLVMNIIPIARVFISLFKIISALFS